MAILGYDTIAGTVYNLSGGANPIISNVVTAPSSGTATQINASVDPFAGTVDFLLGLFEWNSGTSLWDKLDEVLISAVAATGTSTPFTISGAISASIVSGRDYRITCLGNAGYNERYDTLSGSEIASFDDYFASFATGATLSNSQFTDYVPYQSTLWVDYTTGGGGNVTVSPSTGSIVLNGIAPTVSSTDHITVNPSTGAITLNGIAPTVSSTNHISVAPAAGNIALNGIAPNVSSTDHQIVSPATGNINLDGIAPNVSSTNNVTVSPVTGQILIEGIAPVVSSTENITVNPGVGNIQLAGIRPVVDNGQAWNGSVIEASTNGSSIINNQNGNNNNSVIQQNNNGSSVIQ